MNQAVLPVPRKPLLHPRMAPVIIRVATIAGAIIASQAWSFSWPYDDESHPIPFLQRHSTLLGIAGIGVLLLGNAMLGLVRRVAELERRLAEGARSEAA